ncbi:MAG: acyltransferase family protein [Pseudomonadota bacterium]
MAFLPRFQLPQLWQVLFRLVGVLLIVFATFFFDEHMAFPGSLALIPCAGAALIILSGRDRDDRFSLLGSRPFVFVGLISYSWYLWHWPILAFARIHYDNIDLSVPVALGCVIVSFLVAIASWRFIERPFRNPNGPLKRRLSVYIVSVLSLSALVSAGLFISRSDGLPSRFSPEVAELLSHERYWHTDQNLNCENRPTVWSRRCTYGTKTEAAELDYIILEDSHAASLATGLMPALQERGYKGILMTIPGCLPVTGPVRLTRTGGPYELCTIHNSEVSDLLAQREDVPLIILHGKWATHAEGIDRRGPSYSSDLIWSAADGSTSRGQFDLIKDGAIAFQKSLQDNDLDIAIVGTLPAQSWHVPRQLARNLAYGAPRPDPSTRDDYSPEKLGRIDSALSDYADRNETVTYHSLIDLMCETEVCLVQDEHPLYVDSHHLSFAGARYVAQRLIEDLESQLADR